MCRLTAEKHEQQAAGSLGSSFNMMGVLGKTHPSFAGTIGIYEKKNCVTTEGQQTACLGKHTPTEPLF